MVNPLNRVINKSDMQLLHIAANPASGVSRRESRSPTATKMQNPSAALQDLNNNVLFQLCKPFLVIMRIGGIFFLPTKKEPDQLCHADEYLTRDAVSEADIIPSSKWKKFERYCQIYCFLSFAIVISYGCKFAYNFYSVIYPMNDGVMSTTNLATFVLMTSFTNWHVNMIAAQIIVLRACGKGSLIYEFFFVWEKRRFLCSEETCANFVTRFRRARNVIIVFTVVCIILNLLSIWCPALSSSTQYEAVRNVIYAGFEPGNTGICILMLIGHFYASFVYIVPVWFYVLLCHAIVEDFCHLNHDLRQRISDDGTFNGNLEWYRMRHIHLCRLVQHGDDVFSLFTLLCIASSVVQMFMLVFVTFEYGRKGLFSVVAGLTELFWFLLYLMQPALLFGMGMRLNEAAHAPLWPLYQLNHEKLTTAEVLQLHTFLNNLSCNQIGFTAWKMFVVEAPSLLSILGIYCTYQILLFQLQLDFDDKSSNSTK